MAWRSPLSLGPRIVSCDALEAPSRDRRIGALSILRPIIMADTRFPALSNPLASSACRRRGFLIRLLGILGALGLPRASAGAARLDGRVAEFSDSELRIASLGRQFASEEPLQARRLMGWVEAELPLWLRFSEPARRSRIARELLLTPRRLRRDFDRAEVVVIDGWVLARTEGAVAVYLNALVGPERPTR